MQAFMKMPYIKDIEYCIVNNSQTILYIAAPNLLPLSL